MSNKFVNVINARLAARSVDMSENNTNNKRMKRLALLLSKKEIAEFLNKINCDAKMLNKNIYALFKIEDMLDVVFNNAKDMQQMHMCVTRTVILHAKNSVETISTIETQAAISKSYTIADESKHIIFQNNEIKTEKTVDTQSSSSCNALQFFNILTQTAKKDKHNVYKINSENAMLIKMQEHFTTA